VAFTPRTVKDQVVQFPNRFKIDGVSHIIEPDFGIVTEPGTEINKAYLQPIEDALGEAVTKADYVQLKDRVSNLEGIFVSSWDGVQAIVRAGLAPLYFNIGDQFLANYNGSPIVWEVIGINVDEPSDPQFTHSLTIQVQDCIANVQFDAPEPDNPDSKRKTNGNNRYIHSAIRQWLNSEEATFQWVSQHEYDTPPTKSLDIYSGPGFLKLLDPELVAVIGKVDKKIARNTVTDGGGQDTISDKVFLLSQYEVGLGTASAGDVTGEFIYPRYDGIDNAGRIKLLNGSAGNWWLRSPSATHSHYVRSVLISGAVHLSFALNALGAAPACCII
jgi:hypothetical protein